MSRFISPDAPFPERWEQELSVMENCRSYFADWRERRRELTLTQHELAERIRTAFDGVSCGDSLGYMSGFAEDDYCEKDIINAFMQREQRMHWPAITPDWLFGLNECLHYVTPEGFRFLLPAYMLADLQYSYPDWVGLDFHFFSASNVEEKFSLFTPAQRDCVTDYVNEKSLEELREEIWDDRSLGTWKHLLPWEKAALPPDADEKRAAEEILCAYMDKHGIEL